MAHNTDMKFATHILEVLVCGFSKPSSNKIFEIIKTYLSSKNFYFAWKAYLEDAVWCSTPTEENGEFVHLIQISVSNVSFDKDGNVRNDFADAMHGLLGKINDNIRIRGSKIKLVVVYKPQARNKSVKLLYKNYIG